MIFKIAVILDESETMRDRQIFLAGRGISGVYLSMEQACIRPIVTSIVNFDEADLEAAAGTIVDHKEKLE